MTSFSPERAQETILTRAAPILPGEVFPHLSNDKSTTSTFAELVYRNTMGSAVLY